MDAIRELADLKMSTNPELLRWHFSVVPTSAAENENLLADAGASAHETRATASVTLFGSDKKLE